jgi:Mini-chromosome maintenance replisome factor
MNPTAVLNPEETVLLRTYLAQISQMQISIAEEVAEEMQTCFVTKRKETFGEGIDENWFGRRIVIAKGFARIGGRDAVGRDDWQDALDVCAQWESRSKTNA